MNQITRACKYASSFCWALFSRRSLLPFSHKFNLIWQRQKWRKYLSIFVVGICLSLLSYGCGESKVAQCNELVAIANKIHTIEISTDAEGLNNLANQLDQIKAEMQTAEISDRQLKEIQERLVDVYAQASQGERDSSAAKASGDPGLLERASEQIQDAITRSDAIATDVTTYCSSASE
jgi:hypothetical protein